MKHNVLFLLTLVFMLSFYSHAQRGVRIAYIDTEYILENVPEYQEATTQLEDKAQKWKNEIQSKLTTVEQKRKDLSNEKALRAIIQQLKPDIIVNAAAYTAVDKAETEAEKAFEINATGAKNLAQVCNDHDAILIHVSTDFVFDGEKNEPYTETDVANPISVYGASKLQGEVEIQKGLKEHFIIRTSWLYSEYGNNFMKTMLLLAETRDEISVVSDQIGTPTYAGDLAEIIIQIINTKTEKQKTILDMKEDIQMCFACSEISSFKPNFKCKRPYLNVVRGILRKQGYSFISTDIDIKINDVVKRTKKYIILRNN